MQAIGAPSVDTIRQLKRDYAVEIEQIAPVICRATSKALVRDARQYLTAAGCPPLETATFMQPAYQQAFNVGKSMVECTSGDLGAVARQQVEEIQQALIQAP